jgi:hypothetical protein
MGDHKFDRAAQGGSKLPSHMFHSATELIGWSDLQGPAPSHAASFQEWKDRAETVLDDVLGSSDAKLTGSDEKSYEIGKQFGFRALEKFVVKATAVGWASQPPELRRLGAEQILARPQIPQRTPAWYAQGKEVLTASEFAKLYGSPRCVSQLVMSKVPNPLAPAATNRLACMTCEMGPFDWGIRFEPVVKQILEKKWGAKIAEAGRIMHPTDTHVAASPDGIIMEAEDPARVGRLLEIKCPITRVIGGGIPHDYWCQMQVQMEVTGVGECEYVEVKIQSLQGGDTDLSGAVHGYVWLLQNPETCEMRYAYTESEAAALKASGWDTTETIPWRLADMYTVTVTRDMGWFQETAELRRQFWENVEKARRGAFQVVEGRAKTVNVIKEPAVCLIQD